jgi:SAM-dependent methyltransferase
VINLQRHALVPAAVVFLTCLGHAQGQPPRTSAQIWNENYEERARYRVVYEPNGFLASVAEKRKPGAVLDIAMGQGRNALMLADRGWEVTGFDISDVAVGMALAQAKIRGLKLNAVVADGEKFDFGVDRWDMVVSVYTGISRFDDVLRSLKPDGIWVVEAFHRDSFGGGFQSNELFKIFNDRMTVLFYEDAVGRPDLTWIHPPKEFRFVRLVARKESPK